MCVHFPDLSGVVVLDTVYDCVSVLANWTIFDADCCPITGYIVNISGNVVLLAANQTTYSHPISESDCGTTLGVHVSANTVLGTSNITSQSITIVCTRELGLSMLSRACRDVKVGHCIFLVNESGLEFLMLLKCMYDSRQYMWYIKITKR